jgi:acyl carrier protein
MTIARLKSSQKATALREVLASNDVRTLVANHLGVSVGRVTDEAHFTNDLGADWLDRLELMMVVEDHFAGLEITDADVDQIEVVGDLIRHIETVDNERRRRGAKAVEKVRSKQAALAEQAAVASRLKLAEPVRAPATPPA